MEGWKLKEGTISFKQIDDFEVMSLIFRALGPSSARTTSYKFCFFKSLLDNLFNADNRNLSIPFRNIFTTFTSIYYNLIVKWDLFQMSSKNNTVCSIRKIIENFVVEYPQLNGTFIPFESLKSSLQIELINRVQREGMKYVIGAFYGDTNGQIFNFSKKERIVWLNPSAYKTLVRQKNMFEKINYFEWMKFLEKCNENDKLCRLTSKIDESTKRINLTQYRDFLFYSGQHRCAYCGKELSISKTKTPVDHIIPWSFVKDDKLWNLTLSCKSCNSKKSNKLPKNNFIRYAVRRNNIIQQKYKNTNLVKLDFKNYSEDKYKKIYESALLNGFDDEYYICKYNENYLLI